MSQHSKSAIVMAIVGNAVVTLAKGISALVSGSGTMVAETIHSLVDTLNQGLLLIGHQRSLLPPTRRHPYGYGPEANFWGLLAATGILIFGGGLAVQHGIHGILHPVMPDHLGWALGVLLVSALIEVAVLITVLRQVGREREGQPWGRHLHPKLSHPKTSSSS